MQDVEHLTRLYLELLKRCLTDTIYADDPMAPMVPFDYGADRGWLKNKVLHALRAFLEARRIYLVEPHRNSFFDYGTMTAGEIEALRQKGEDWPPRAHTMIGRRRLDNLQHCVESVIRDDVPGDLLEAGVWRGGATILMRAVLAAFGETGRTVWVADSFTGLPPPDPGSYPADADDRHHTQGFLAVSRAQVARNFERYGLLDGQVKFLEGWFRDTMATAPIRSLAVLRLDGDMYESTIEVLDGLYRKVSPGGYVIVDDYALPACRSAITDFRERERIAEPIVPIDNIGVYWRVADAAA